MDRRGFLRTAGAGALAASGAVATLLGTAGAKKLRAEGPFFSTGSTQPDVVVVGAGAFGGWTALRLREMGARVTLVDLYGPGNSRAASGDETRGIRSSYGGRDLWTSWANRAMERWRAFDREWAQDESEHLFFPTGDLLIRDEWNAQYEEIRETWERNQVPHEVLTPEEVGYRWPQISIEGIGAALFEPGAGVARSRAASRRVAQVFRLKGGVVRTARATPGRRSGGRLLEVTLDPGEPLGAELFVFALGPWFPKAFPELMAPRIRLFMGHVYYFGTPPGDARFSFPNLPSFGIAGATGWPAIPPDHRGFRVRTGGRASDDPDEAVRWIPEEYHEQAIGILQERFPGIASQPIVETRACHYESSVTREWIIDRHPELENVWVAGGGSAEGFKFGPLLGELIAGRAIGRDPHPELDDQFRIRETDLDPPGTGA